MPPQWAVRPSKGVVQVTALAPSAHDLRVQYTFDKPLLSVPSPILEEGHLLLAAPRSFHDLERHELQYSNIITYHFESSPSQIEGKNLGKNGFPRAEVSPDSASVLLNFAGLRW